MWKATARVTSSGAQISVVLLKTSINTYIFFIIPHLFYFFHLCLFSVMFLSVSKRPSHHLVKREDENSLLESQTSAFNVNVSSFDKFYHFSLLFCYLIYFFILHFIYLLIENIFFYTT